MVDLTGYFWNQVHEQFSAWYKELAKVGLTQLLAIAMLYRARLN